MKKRRDPVMITTSLFKVIQSELMKQGFNEYVNQDGNLVFFDEDAQFMTKILNYDEDIKEIMVSLFNGVSLDDRENDEHFKKIFLYRFINREMNRQTIEAFKLELMSTFLMNKTFIEQVYNDLEKYITNENESEQINKQTVDGHTIGNNRQAFSDLPQSSVQLDLNDDTMTTASDNTISKNKQNNNQETDGSTKNKSKSYQLDQLLQSSTIWENVFELFDEKCFLQVW